MTILPEKNGIDNAIQKKFESFVKRFKINALLKSVGATKEKGVPAGSIYTFLMGLIFTHKNLYTLLNTGKGSVAFGKDVVYRFLSKARTHWETFVFRLGISVINKVNSLTTDQRRCALIVDDTPYYRNRSKQVELLSRCYDHSENRYYKGYSMLTLGWSDGQTFIPLDFRLVASGNDKSLLCPSQVTEDNRTMATKRRTVARKDKPTLVLDMLASAKDTIAQAKYVLFDSWFASPASILSIKRLGYHVVARLKNHNNFRYLYQDQCLSLNQIYKMCKKRRGLSRYLLSVEVQVRHNEFSETIPAKLVFIRDKNNRKKWIALISTDNSLAEDEIISLYGKRWDIEPYHKVLKSCLHLTTEFQLRSFDAITAHTAIVLSRYIFLSLENRENKDERTMGALFYAVCDELDDISFAQAFALILSTFEHWLRDYLKLANEQIILLVHQFLSHLPVCIMDKLAFFVCES